MSSREAYFKKIFNHDAVVKQDHYIARMLYSTYMFDDAIVNESTVLWLQLVVLDPPLWSMLKVYVELVSLFYFKF